MVFLLGLFLILQALSFALKPGNEEIYNIVAVKQKRDNIAKEKSDSIDVFFLGDSMAYSGFSPIQMWNEQGFTSYIGAINAQRLCDGYAILKSTLQKQSPEVIVLETNCLYRYAGIEQDKDDKVFNLAGRIFPVLKYHSRWKDILCSCGLDLEINDEVKTKGFRERSGVMAYNGGNYMAETDRVKKVPEISEKYLEQIEKLCAEHGAKLIFVSSPSAKNWNYAKHNGTKAYADEHGIPFVDLNLMTEELGIDWKKDTKDGGDHLNKYGARKVSEYVGSYLKEHYDLPDRRKQDGYSDWAKQEK